MKLSELFEMSTAEISDAESEIKRLFLQVRLIIKFSYHFGARIVDGATDEAGTKRDNVTYDELLEVFKKLKKQHDLLFNDAASFDDEVRRGEFEGVIQDTLSKINVPFALAFNKKQGKFELSCKTIMKRKNFHVKPKDHLIKV